jgi:hypothetical protein
LARTAGDDQAVVRDLAPSSNALDDEAAGVEIDADDFAEDDGRVPLVPEDVADRRCDVALRQNPRRNLVEQRLEQVVIRPVDHREVDVGAPS